MFVKTGEMISLKPLLKDVYKVVLQYLKSSTQTLLLIQKVVSHFMKYHILT